MPTTAAGPSLDSSGSDLFWIRPGHESGAATQQRLSASTAGRSVRVSTVACLWFGGVLEGVCV